MKTKSVYMPLIVVMLAFITAALFTQNTTLRPEPLTLEERVAKLEARINRLEISMATKHVVMPPLPEIPGSTPMPDNVEQRLQRLETQVFNPPVKIVPCEQP
ncbi:hypothetical protein JW948_02695 [bacterium]|nr:hypothetical protein [bacterium]